MRFLLRSFPLRALLLASLFLAVGGVHAATQDEGPRTFLRNVHVVDLEQGRILRDQSLVIAGERIAGLAPASELVPPAGATVIDGRGRYVLPGLFDMHVHLAEDHAPETLALFVANGVTTVQCMSGSPWHLALRKQLARGEVFGPRLYTCGPTTATLRVHTVEQAERVVREQRAAGYDAVKMYGDGSNTMPVETYQRLVATGHEFGIRVVGHAPRNLPFDAVLAARQDSIDHMEEIVYTEKSFEPVLGTYVNLQFGRERFEDHPDLPAQCPDFRAPLADAVRALAERVHAAGLRVTPTLVTFATIQATTDDGLFPLLARDELRYASPTARAEWTPERTRFRNGDWKPHLALVSSYLARSVELQAEMLRAFHAAGVPLMTGTDAPFDLVLPGFSLHDELARFVAAGLTPLDALRCATLVPAQCLGLANDSGAVRTGLRADLVLLEADPLADIAATRRVAGVFLRGAWLAPEVLAERLADIARRNAALEQRLTRVTAALDAREFAKAFALRREGEPDLRLDAWLEERVNEAGYTLLRAKKAAEAVAVLRLNAEAFPKSFNAWDSLGEACLEHGDLEEALEHYERSIELNPASESGKRAIDRILARLDEHAPAEASKAK